MSILNAAAMAGSSLMSSVPPLCFSTWLHTLDGSDGTPYEGLHHNTVHDICPKGS